MYSVDKIPPEKLGDGSGIRLEVCATEFDLYWQVALEVFELIQANNRQGKPSLMIMPFGPVGPYQRLAWLVNKYRLSLKACTFINMDEYLNDDLTWIDKAHPFSFRGGMEREFYSLVDPELNVPERQRIFPEPGREREVMALIEKAGGLDLCLGGIGINGHVAFNEPPEPDVTMSNDAFRDLPTRILKLARETRTINAYMNCAGFIEGIPANCITVGMKEIWQARKIRLCMPRDWNAGIIRRVLHGEVTCHVPCSLFQEHPDALLYAARVATALPEPAIRIYNKS